MSSMGEHGGTTTGHRSLNATRRHHVGRRTRSTRGWIASLVAITVLASACTSKDDAGSSPTTDGSETPDDTSVSTGTPTDVVSAGFTSGQVLPLKLSEGTSQAGPAEPVAVVDGTPIDPAAVTDIFSRLPEWIADPELRESFNWPAESLAPPRTGSTNPVPFPAPDQAAPPDAPSGPLEVVRFQPDGEVPIAPFVSVTFNQPMVPLGTVTQLDGRDVPVTITPEIPGRWQWIGTRTLRFDATSDVVDRLPMATEYTVTIPAGTASANGGALASEVSWTFATPPVTVSSLAQDARIDLALDTVFVATFDQRIDPAAVLAATVLTAQGDERQIRLASAEEIEASDIARQIAATAPEARWIAFRAVDDLPADAAIEIRFGPEMPSVEGPRTTTDSANFMARTYAPLRVNETGCSYEPDCPPGSELNITFNNQLDAANFDPSTITVSPALGSMSVGLYGNTMAIRGRTQARTTYTVTLPATLTDTFGQTLANDSTEEIKIGSAAKLLQPFNLPLTTLDPHATGRSVPVISVNHDSLKVTTYNVTADEWPVYAQWLARINQGDPSKETPDAPFTATTESTLRIDAAEDETAETQIDLTKAFTNGRGHVVVLVEPTERFSPNDNEFWQNRPTITWVQATDIGLDASADNDELAIWATSLTSGTPLDAARVELTRLVPYNYDDAPIDTSPAVIEATVTTAGDGTARAALEGSIGALIATVGDDTAVLPSGYYGESWQRYEQQDEVRWFTFDDRQVYRPGETISVKGWVRRVAWSTDAQLALLDAGTTLSYTVFDPYGSEIGSGTTDVNRLGGFDFTADLPAEANLGSAYVNIRLENVPGISYAETQHAFQIQEFRRPEFEVTARNESTAASVSAKPATLAVDATYFAGGPLAAAPVDWQVSTSSASYSPPGWDTYTFGIWTPWWFDTYGGFDGGYDGGRYSEPCCFPGPDGASTEVEQYSGVTDSNGEHFLQIDFEEPEGGFPDLPVTVSAQATVTDVNRQAWSSTTNLLVHPGELYVGLASDRTFVKQGDPLDIDVIVTDIDGAAVAGRNVTVTASRLEWVFADGTWTEQPVTTEDCATTSATEAVICTFATEVGGSYRISSTITDDAGGKSRTELTRWVSGGDAKPSRNVEQETATIIPDKATYQPGEAAELLIQSPFSPATGLLTTIHNGITSTETFTVTDGSAVLSVPISDNDIPNIGVTVELVGAAQRTGDDGKPLADAPPRVAYAVGQLSLRIPPTTRTLTVDAVPANDEVTPGSETSIDVTVSDASGQPVEGAEFAIVVVDEAVLALSQYTLASPLSAFYPDVPSYVQSIYGRQSIILANPELLDGSKSAAGGDVGAAAATEAPAAEMETAETTAAAAPQSAPADGALSRQASFDTAGVAPGGTAPTPIDVRTNFDALAVFEPEVTTDAAGSATIAVPLPDNLTRYRVMVVAVDGSDRFGSTESNLTARLPLMVRPSAPRFLNFGDQFELPVVVQNQSDQPLEVNVVIQADNLTVDGGSGTGSSGKLVTVPANDRVEVRFPASASEAGTARFQVAATSGELADAATIELPVYTPSTAEAFATYGVLDGGSVIQPLAAPTDVIRQFGGLDITTSSTSLQALTDAVLYLSDYPYDSADAASSRIQAIAALRPVLDAFDAPGLPSAATLDAAVERDLERLRSLQNSNGGWSYWRRDDESVPFVTVQAAHALILARDAGYTVDQFTLDAAMAYLADVESYIPSSYGEDARDAISAYALNVRSLNGGRDTAKAEALWERRGEKLPLDALAWIWPVVADGPIDEAIEKVFANQVIETAGAANFTTNYGDDANFILSSDRRSDGIILDALISERPDSDLIPKVVTGLLANQTKGRWDNVQENAFILLALKRYFETYEAQTPDFVARVWLGDRYAGEQVFDGRSVDRTQVSIPTADVIAAGDSSIIIDQQGTGRLYYRLGLRYSPVDLTLDPLDRGFVVERTYEAVDDPADVSRDADGTWRIKAGARVRVTLSMVAESQRAHVALVDPLPAGFEVLNPAFAVTQEAPADDGSLDGGSTPTSRWYDSFWYWTWFDHQNLRDDRAEAFSSFLAAGTYDYSYIARATTPGTFVAPPTRAEEIYSPETFGRSATATVVIG